ncbi:MAG: S8 family peptidase [Chloroflexi bacterium]|nr:S8 family peptidase [Chloroflexota bacterium]
MISKTALTMALRLGLLAALILSSLLPSVGQAAKAGDTEKIDPYLAALIDSGASGPFPVIVQIQPGSPGKGSPPEQAKAEHAKDLITKASGKPGRALGIVNGASGQLKPAAIKALSKNPNVQYISYDGVIGQQSLFSGDMVDYAALVNAPAAWAKGYTGAGVGVAVLDSGIQPNADLGLGSDRIVASVNLASDTALDPGGHGTHIAGIIGGKGNGWSGVAPDANLINVRVLEAGGGARLSTVVAGIQWVVNNRKAYNIQVLNISLGMTPAVSYKQDPLAGAVEMAWHAGIVVVAAAGNSGSSNGTIHSPGHDPYVVTVGALDPAGTLGVDDDTVAFYSSRGPTLAWHTKPDLLTPGRKVVSLRVPESYLDLALPDRVVETGYFRLSGTSQATAVASGVAALLLQKDPSLKPDQVKYILKHASRPLAGFDANAQGSGVLDASSAVTYTEVRKDNRGLRPSNGFAATCLKCISKTVPPSWKDLSFSGGVDSRGTSWTNVTWDNVLWDNVTWDNLLWDNVLWDNVFWDNVLWDNVTWDSAAWDSAGWDAASFD